jgi:hypothetical protein
MFEILYASISERLAQQHPQNGFNVEDLFTKEEWDSIGDRTARQSFGRRFATDVRKGRFVGVTRNELANNPGGNEARYNYAFPL